MFDESKWRPRTLPCGHTFCSPCIGNMMDGGQLSCPTCRTHHLTTAQFPINYHAEALLKQLKSIKLRQETPGAPPPLVEGAVGGVATVALAGATFQKKQSTGVSRKLRSVLEDQKSSVSSGVVAIQEVQSQLDQYRSQLADWKTQHLHLLNKLYHLVEQNRAALELLEQEDTRVLSMKEEGEEGEKQLEAVLGCLYAVNSSEEVVRAIDHADHCTEEAEEWTQRCCEFFPDINTVTTSRKVQEVTRMVLGTGIGDVASGAEDTDGETSDTEASGVAEVPIPLVTETSSVMDHVEEIIIQQGLVNIEDLRRMRPPVKKLVEAGHVFGIQKDQGGFRSSRITLENGQLYFHCLRDQPPLPRARTLPVNEVMGALDTSSIIAFLDLSWPGTARGRVHIRLSPDTSLARQFVLLCTGQRGHTYLNTALFQVLQKGDPGEWVWGGDYQYSNGEGGASLLPHPWAQYRESGRAGAVWSAWGPGSDLSAQFAITTRDRQEGREFPYVIGEVKSGMEVVRAAVNHRDIAQVTVVDCGVVVPI